MFKLILCFSPQPHRPWELSVTTWQLLITGKKSVLASKWVRIARSLHKRCFLSFVSAKTCQLLAKCWWSWKVCGINRKQRTFALPRNRFLKVLLLLWRQTTLASPCSQSHYHLASVCKQVWIFHSNLEQLRQSQGFWCFTVYSFSTCFT